MPSFRDRFFTRKVATAMVSPSAIVAAGSGAAVGVVAGGAGGPVGAVVGGIVGAVAGWAARVGAAIPRSPRRDRIDPFTLQEPWRALVRDALAARTQFSDAVRRTQAGPIKERLAAIGTEIDDLIDQAWAAARGGHELAAAYSRIDAQGAQRELDRIGATGEQTSPTVKATAAAIRAQLATAHRMYDTITATRNRLELLNARLDEAVARCIELSVGAFRPDAFAEVEGEVVEMTGELEALRSALDETAAAERSGAGAAPRTQPG